MDLLDYHRTIFFAIDSIDRGNSLFYNRLYRLVVDIIGGGLFPVIELDSPIYYGIDGSARCDSLYVYGSECYFIDNSFGINRCNPIHILPFNIVKRVVKSLLNLEYHLK